MSKYIYAIAYIETFFCQKICLCQNIRTYVEEMFSVEMTFMSKYADVELQLYRKKLVLNVTYHY
jgi:hypothetical protein